VGKNVEYDVVANDKVDAGLAAAERKFLETQKKIAAGAEKSTKTVGDGLGKSVGAAVPGIVGKLQGALATSGVLGGKALAVGLVATAPLIGATVSAAIIGGVGLGGVIGGVALVRNDPRVAAAGRGLGQKLKAGLEQDAGSFVDPVLRNVDKIGKRFDGLRPRIRSIFNNSSGFLDPLVDGTLEGVDKVLAGVDRLVSKAQPVMDSLGRGIAMSGDAIGQAFAIIGDDAENAASALDLVFRGLSEFIVKSAMVVRGLTEVYGAMDRFGTSVNNTIREVTGLGTATERLTGSGTFGAQATQDLATATFLAGLRAQGASGPIVTLSDQINGLSQSSRDAFSAETNLARAIDSATDAARSNGRTLDANTEKGRANRDALSQVAATMRDKFNATVALNGAGEQSNGVANSNRAAFIRLATSMGASKARAQELANQLGIVAGKKPRPTVRLDDAGVQSAIRRIQASLDAIPRTIRTRVFVSKVGEVTYGGGGGRQGSNFDASSFHRAGSSDGVHRTGGPAPVQVTSDVVVNLDGAPFYRMSAQAAQAATDRAAWRQRVGTR